MVEMLLIVRKGLQPATFLAAMESLLAGDVFLIQWNVLKID
ncbi:hypothetical protein DEU39_1958 [Chryseobacterium sp. AG363]|nr:hypothetical protein DEU39_1958 [Chryseobacterium sp. AG363]